MIQIIEGSWLARAVHVIVSLGVPDLLRDGPKQSAELAAATGTYAPALHRVLRALAVAGIFAADDLERFYLTPIGATLQTDVPGSLHAWALLMLGEQNQGAWTDILHSVRTGQSAFQRRYGVDIWQYCSQHAQYARL